MPIDEERPDFTLDLTSEAKRTVQAKIMSSGVAGVLSLVPGVGAAVTEMMTELAIQRTNQRMNEMFSYFTNRIRDVGEGKFNREWFRSEEFQTLLFEALRQLHVTHDRDKIQMLGVALANSGMDGFGTEERNDLFIHFVRDLTRLHLKVLVALVPRALSSSELPPMAATVLNLDENLAQRLAWQKRPRVTPQGEDLLALQMLHAYGLAEEEIKSSVKEPRTYTGSRSQLREEIFRNLMTPEVTRSFRLSSLGDEFLKFVGLPKDNEDGINPQAQAGTRGSRLPDS